MADKNLMKIIDTIPLFKNFTKSDTKRICALCKKVEIKKDETIFREGDDENSLYIILDGRVKIYKSKNGKEIVLAELEKGDFFGEMEILHPSKTGRTASAKAETDVVLLKVTKDRIDAAIKRSRIYAFKLIHFFAKVLCERLRRMDDAYTELFLENRGENRLNELKSFRENLIKEWGF